MTAPAPHSQPGTDEAAEALAFAVLTTPRPIDEYHEDMGPMLWWHWERVVGPTDHVSFRWAGEPPYVGSPLDLGITVEAHTTTRIISQRQQDHDPDPHIERVTLGGWPGYHTHFTMIPMPRSPVVPLEQSRSGK